MQNESNINKITFQNFYKQKHLTFSPYRTAKRGESKKDTPIIKGDLSKSKKLIQNFIKPKKGGNLTKVENLSSKKYIKFKIDSQLNKKIKTEEEKLVEEYSKEMKFLNTVF